jgi:hypothetical protein
MLRNSCVHGKKWLLLKICNKKIKHFLNPLFIYKQSNFNIIIMCFYNITPRKGVKKEQQISLISTSWMEHVQTFEDS